MHLAISKYWEKLEKKYFNMVYIMVYTYILYTHMYNIYTVLRVELCVVIGIIPGNRFLYAYACCALNQNCCPPSPKTTFQASQEFTIRHLEVRDPYRI